MSILETVIGKVHGGTFVSIDTLTNVTLLGGKKNPFKDRIQKAMTGANVMIFQNKTTNAYENMVHKRLAEEGKDPEDFVLSPRVWGERIPNSPFVHHNGKLYLECIFLKAGTVQYLLDGVPIPKENIPGLQVVEESEQGGLERKVIIRTFAEDSIKVITIDNQRVEL